MNGPGVGADMTYRSGHKFRAAWLFTAATLALLATSPSQASVGMPGSLGQIPIGVIKVEDPEPLPDKPAAPQQRVTPQDRVIQPAPAMQQEPQQAPGALQRMPAPPPQPDTQKGTADTPR